MLKLIQTIFKPFCTQYEVITQQYMNSRKGSYMERHFVDRVKLLLQAGTGGNGCVSNIRTRSITTGAPDGGNGGNGGDIYITTNKYIYDLSRYRKPEIKGNPGKPGHSGKSDGKKGGDFHLQVPVGTLVFEILNQINDKHTYIDQSGEAKTVEKPFKFKQFNTKLIGDLSELGQSVLVAKGGQGGKGNAKNIHIKKVELGKTGQIKEILLELKIIADVGLVGFPNVGKSTLLASVCRSLPKIDNYMFTTLSPSIGKVEFVDNQSFTMADIPGIIEDAHKNKGLGISFLRHIERTKALIFVLDATDNNPLQTYKILNIELDNYREDFKDKPRYIILNKCDLNPNSEQIGQQLSQQLKQKVYCVSAKHGFQIGELLKDIKQKMYLIQENQRQQQIEHEQKQREGEIRRILLDREFLDKSKS